MAYKCEICGKKPKAGKSVSHSHKASNRRFKPNLSRQKVFIGKTAKKVYVCSRCLRSGAATKAV